MGYSLTPLPSYGWDNLIIPCSEASSSKQPQLFCWVHSIWESTGDLRFKSLECNAFSSRGSCRSKLYDKNFCSLNHSTLNPCRKLSSRLRAWPNVSSSAVMVSGFTTLASTSEPLSGSARNSARGNILLHDAPEELPSASVPLEGDPGKVFIGNLPYHVKRADVKEFFSQCGPVRDIIFIRSHTDPEKNKGFCFLFFGGPDPNAAASRAAELDGANFFGKPMRVKIDDGRWERDRREQRERWIESGAVC